MKTRGFIGPLGDDIPSIFPIVAGMLLFIGTILYANAQVDARSAELQQREATQKLAYLATQKASYTGNEFAELCENSLRPFAKNSGLKFAVVVKRFCEGGIQLQGSNVFNEDETPAGSFDINPRFVCTTDNPEAEQEYKAARLDRNQAPKNAVVLIHPFTVPCPDDSSTINGLATLNVIVWK